jgi:acetylornithine deacetylase/succinyl-diaminopimelate desuccinylase-like protein
MVQKEDSFSARPNPIELLQKLIRFDTTNPPGNEAECISFINQLLTQAGIETKILAKSQQRPNLIARLPGQGIASPLLLYGHVDVVTTENQSWKHPPFEGKIVDGYVWGRGALDMKAGIAMMVTALLRAKSENMKPPGDVVLAIVSDEEAGGDYGAKFLVEEHPEEFEGIRYALGEFGGFTFSIGKRRFYPIQIAEKQLCWLRVTFSGPGGHGSIPVRGGATAKLSRFLNKIDKHSLPVHVTPPAHFLFSSLASALGGVRGWTISQLLKPKLADYVLKLLGKRGRLFNPLLHNTISPTILHGSNKINVIPSEVSVELDGRLLPGLNPDDLIKELRKFTGKNAKFEVIRHDHSPVKTDMGLFDTLAGILKELDPNGVPIPMLMAAFTDGRFFSRLGIQTYGYIPMKLPEEFKFTETIHAADERIPIEAVEFGSNAIYLSLQRFGT